MDKKINPVYWDRQLQRAKARTVALRTLLKAVTEAGGAAKQFSVIELEEMTALELVEILGQNGIRFVFDPHCRD